MRSRSLRKFSRKVNGAATRYSRALLREDLGHLVTSTLDRLIESGELPLEARGPVEIIDTKQPEHGDYACNFALTAAKRAGMNPRDLATKLRDAIFKVDGACADEPNPASQRMVSEGSPAHGDRRRPLIHEIDIAGPGFLNFRLKPESVASYVKKVLDLGNSLPNSEIENPKSINVEFVSVNPNGPITVGSARGAAYGDTLCRVLAAAGNRVHREYYINDGVNSEQMRLFAESVRHYYHGGLGLESAFPEKGYRGDYVQDVAADIRRQFGDGHDRELADWFQARSQELMIKRQRQDLHSFGVDFNTWFSEQSLHDSGTVEQAIDELVVKGAADDRAFRTVLKLARGGVIESAERQLQTEGVEVDEDGEPLTPKPVSPDVPQGRGGFGATGDEAQVGGDSGQTLWLRSTKFGDDMDRVLRRRDGRLTYIASDVAYHRDKLTDASDTRGTGAVDKLITILGPDHHGYIARLQAVVAALLEDPSIAPSGTEAAGGVESFDDNDSIIFKSPEEKQACLVALTEARRRLEVVIFQIVRFVKDGKPAPMRKRDGNIYELRDLINELGAAVAAEATKEGQQRVGADVARFFYLTRSHDTHMDFDIDLATKQSDDNPVFYVQYAHARICSVIRKAGESGIERTAATSQGLDAPTLSLLTHERETALIKKILDLPFEVRRCAEDYGVHRLTTYAIELARAYHHFYDACRVIQPEQPELSRARLALCEAARLGLQSALDLLGVSAPERMDREPAR